MAQPSAAVHIRKSVACKSCWWRAKSGMGENDGKTNGPSPFPFPLPESAACLRFRSAMSRSFLAAEEAARLVSSMLAKCAVRSTSVKGPCRGGSSPKWCLRNRVHRGRVATHLGEESHILADIPYPYPKALSPNHSIYSVDMDATEGIETPNKPLKPRKRFVGTSKPSSASSSKGPIRRVANQIPDSILHDPELNEAIRGG